MQLPMNRIAYYEVVLMFSALCLAIVGCEKDSSSTQPSLGDAQWHEVGAAGEPAFQSNWSNYDTTSYSTCAFRIDGQNYVHLKGTIVGGAANSPIFTLPEGYRPSQTLMFDPYGGTTNSNVSVYPTGVVFKGPNFNTFASLDGIVFHADK